MLRRLRCCDDRFDHLAYKVVVMLNRRSLITGLISFVAAPAVVRADSLMKIKPNINKEFIISEYIPPDISINFQDAILYCRQWYDPVRRTIRLESISYNEFYEASGFANE